MIKFNIDLTQFTKAMDDIAKRQIPFATSKALNTVASIAKDDLKKEIQKDFDRPTAFTQNSLYVKYSNKRNLVAEVGVKPIAARYLIQHVRGGSRLRKKVEGAIGGAGRIAAPWAIPAGGVPVTAGGNVTKATYGKILAAMQGQPPPGKKGKRKLAAYWLGVRKGETKPFGIMTRKGRNVKLALAFSKTPQYSKRFKVAETVMGTMKKNFVDVFRIELQKAIGNAR